tara:strand:+ start:6070 stop:7251 length:1182 start_codon:yes stop_codon:yes gene_type:complete
MLESWRSRRRHRLHDEVELSPCADSAHDSASSQSSPNSSEATPAPPPQQPLFAACALVAVAVAKTLLTKVALRSIKAPVAFSIVSCLVTNVGIGCILVARPSTFKLLQRGMLRDFGIVCVTIAIDLGCTNVAISLISLALQQCIRGASPAATIVIEALVRRVCQRPAVVAVVLLGCVGPILTGFGSVDDDAAADGAQDAASATAAATADVPTTATLTPSSIGSGALVGRQTAGTLFMVASVLGQGVKNVFAHRLVTEQKETLGLPSFIFWAEWVSAALLLPWAALDGDLATLWDDATRASLPAADWAIFWLSAALGGARVFAQYYFLQQTSAASLAVSNIAIQALTSALSIVFFHTPPTPLLLSGVALTITTTSAYAWLKLHPPTTLGPQVVR